MTRIDALKALLEKVKAGDDAGFRAANRAVFSTPCQDVAMQLREEHCRHAYKGSLDAAKALHEALLPAPLFQWHLSNEVNFDGFVGSIFGCKQDRYIATSHNADPARAWLIATLKALISIEESKE